MDSFLPRWNKAVQTRRMARDIPLWIQANSCLSEDVWNLSSVSPQLLASNKPGRQSFPSLKGPPINLTWQWAPAQVEFWKGKPQKYKRRTVVLETLETFGQCALLSSTAKTANGYLLASLTDGCRNEKNGVWHPVLNPSQHHIVGLDPKSFILRDTPTVEASANPRRLFLGGQRSTCLKTYHLAQRLTRRIMLGQWWADVENSSCPHLVRTGRNQERSVKWSRE